MPFPRPVNDSVVKNTWGQTPICWRTGLADRMRTLTTAITAVNVIKFERKLFHIFTFRTCNDRSKLMSPPSTEPNKFIDYGKFIELVCASMFFVNGSGSSSWSNNVRSRQGVNDRIMGLLRHTISLAIVTFTILIGSSDQTSYTVHKKSLITRLRAPYRGENPTSSDFHLWLVEYGELGLSIKCLMQRVQGTIGVDCSALTTFIVSYSWILLELEL
jgi:hypothetical protein